MTQKTWRYHATHKPCLVDVDEEKLAEMHEKGWRDSPAAFKDKEPKQEGGGPAPELSNEQQALLDVFQEEPESLDKDELMLLGKGLGLKLIKSWKEPTLVSKIQEHLESQ